MTGALIGFWAGLALDVAPPGSHFVGQNALVFCLIGYVCGLAADVPNSEGVPEQGHTALFEIVVTAAGAVLGEALAALLGAMLSDPRVTWSAIRHVLPVAVVYDVLLCPFVLYAAAAALRLAGAPRGERTGPTGAVPARRRRAPPRAHQADNGGTPRLRLSERGQGEGLSAGRARGPALAKREPRLKLGHGGSLGGAPRSARAVRHTAGARRGQVRARPRRWRARRLTARRRGRAELSAWPAPGWTAGGSAGRGWAGRCSAARCSAAHPRRCARRPRQEVRLDRPLVLPGPLALPGPLVRAGPLVRRSAGSSSGWAARRRSAASPHGRPPAARPRRLGGRPPPASRPPRPRWPPRCAGRPGASRACARARPPSARRPGPVPGRGWLRALVAAARLAGPRPGRRAASPAGEPARPGCTCRVPEAKKRWRTGGYR